MSGEISGRRTPAPEIIGQLAESDNRIICTVFRHLQRRLREENGLSLGYLWRASLRDCRDQVGLGQTECEILSEAAAWLGRYDADEQVAGLEQIARRLAAARDTAAGELQNKGICTAPAALRWHSGGAGADLRTEEHMDVDLIFRIAAVGILVAVLGQLLTRSGREEQALMTTLAGLIVVLMLIVQEISQLFSMMKSVFGFLNSLIAACGLVLLVLVLSMTLKRMRLRSRSC